MADVSGLDYINSELAPEQNYVLLLWTVQITALVIS